VSPSHLQEPDPDNWSVFGTESDRLQANERWYHSNMTRVQADQVGSVTICLHQEANLTLVISMQLEMFVALMVYWLSAMLAGYQRLAIGDEIVSSCNSKLLKLADM